MKVVGKEIEERDDADEEGSKEDVDEDPAETEPRAEPNKALHSLSRETNFACRAFFNSTIRSTKIAKPKSANSLQQQIKAKIEKK